MMLDEDSDVVQQKKMTEDDQDQETCPQQHSWWSPDLVAGGKDYEGDFEGSLGDSFQDQERIQMEDEARVSEQGMTWV